MSKKLHILGIAGSLRKNSYNEALLQAAKTLTPEEAELEIFDIKGIPHFDQDIEAQMPSLVQQFKDKIEKSDAILIATPEYNYSIPGVLKNALDWASRPYGDNSWEDKPVAIMSTSIGMLGGARAQYALRKSFVFLNMHPVNRPEVIVPFAAEKFEDGILTDQHTKDKIHELLQALVIWTKRLSFKQLYSLNELNIEDLKEQEDIEIALRPEDSLSLKQSN